MDKNSLPEKRSFKIQKITQRINKNRFASAPSQVCFSYISHTVNWAIEDKMRERGTWPPKKISSVKGRKSQTKTNEPFHVILESELSFLRRHYWGGGLLTAAPGNWARKASL